MTQQNTIICGLVKDSREVPVDKYIFDSLDNMYDYKTVNHHIFKFLCNEVGIKFACGYALNQNKSCDSSESEILRGASHLIVYIRRESSPVIASLIRVCALNGVALTLMHYSYMEGTFIPQEVFS